MSLLPDKSGPAFPMPLVCIDSGMSLRSWYKSQALQLIDSRYTHVGNEAACAYEIARYAGIVADALLAEDIEHAKKETKP